jgi:hypothetical protein
MNWRRIGILASSVLSLWVSAACAGDVHYSLLLTSQLNNETYRNTMGNDYYSIVTGTRLTKFDYIAVRAPSCSSYLFPNFLKLAAKLEAAKTISAKLIYYTRPVGSDDFERTPLASAGCAPYGTTPGAYMSGILGNTGLKLAGVDLESLKFPTGVNVGPEILNYLTGINAALPGKLWVWNTAYPEKFMTATGQFFTFDNSGNITGNTVLTPQLLAQVGGMVWMDFHTMFKEQSNPRKFVDNRLQQIAALSGTNTVIQIGMTCLNGEVSLVNGSPDQETMSETAYEAEIVTLDAFNIGIRNFNIYLNTQDYASPYWKSYHSWMRTASANFPNAPNVTGRPANPNGIAKGTGCLPE